MKRPRKPPPPPVFTPHECVIVNVDPGECSGYAITIRGKLEDFGECDVFAGGPQRVLEMGLELARERRLACVLVIEKPFVRRPEQGGYNTTGTGTADKIWRVMAKRLGFSRRIIRVHPSSWRARVLDKGMHAAKRPVVRENEQTKALSVARAHGIEKVPGPDASPAVMIAEWSKFSGEVAVALAPKTRARKAG